jgi:PAS domain S-box-containing protein
VRDDGCTNILLVEDEAVIAVAQKRALEKRGYSVAIAGSGAAAIAACAAGGIDLVLMDINLRDGIDGTEAAKIILERQDLPLVFLSSHTEVEVVEKTERITPYGYVVKNSGDAVLDASIKMAFKLHEADRKLEAEKERLQTVLDSIGDAVIAADRFGYVTQMNPLAERLTGQGAADAVGKPLREVLAAFGGATPSDGGPFPDAQPGPSFMDAWEHSPSLGREAVLRRKGSDLRLSFSSAAVEDGRGALSGVVLAFRDVTEDYASREALRLRENYLTAIIENQPGLVWLKDLEGRFLAVNSAFLRSCGLGSQGELVGKTDLDIWPRDLAEKYRADDRAVMESGRPRVTEEPIYDGGTPTWYETFKAPILDESGRAIGSTGYSREIDERKRSQAEYEESVGRYKAFVNLAVVGMAIESADGRIVEANAGFCRLLGLEREAVIGSSAGSLLVGAGAEGNPRQADPRLAGEIETSERSLRRPDGSEAFVEIRSTVMPDGSRLSLYLDATEKKLGEESLRIKSLFLEAVANSSADGILVVDLRGQKILQNQRTLDLWKIPPEVANDPDGMKQVAHVMSMTKNPQLFVDEIERQKRAPLEINEDQLELVDGTLLDRHSAPVLGADGKNYGRIYHFHDVTRFREAENEIRGLLDEKELILREAHHRVKNYMGTLLSLLSLQAASLTEESAIKALEDAQGRIQSMLLLYDKLYVSDTFGSISAAAYLPFLVDEIVGNFPSRTAVTIEKRIEDFTLDAKTMRDIGIIVNELLTNIMKYAFEGRDRGRISVSAAMGGGEVSLVVQDDGVGLAEGVQPGRENGFGLRLVGMLAKQLGGSIGIERGSGTKFTLAFPASSPGPAPSPRAPMPNQVG